MYNLLIERRSLILECTTDREEGEWDEYIPQSLPHEDLSDYWKIIYFDMLTYFSSWSLILVENVDESSLSQCHLAFALHSPSFGLQVKQNFVFLTELFTFLLFSEQQIVFVSCPLSQTTMPFLCQKRDIMIMSTTRIVLPCRYKRRGPRGRATRRSDSSADKATKYTANQILGKKDIIYNPA